MNRSIVLAAALVCLGMPGAAQTITVSQPAAGVTWNAGGTYLIQWTSPGVTAPTVKIMLWQGSANVLDIAPSAPNSGSYSWTIPATLAPGAYRVRVKAVGENVLGVGEPFNVGAPSAEPANPPKKVSRPIDPSLRAGVALKFPALAITNITATHNGSGYVVTFGYKNSGTGPFPKGADLPEKPDFRVLIDGREVNRGKLFIPESPAPPGWELPTFQGCFVKDQSPVWSHITRFDWEFGYGDVLELVLNENKVGGMDSVSRRFDLRGATLRQSYDAYISGASLDWDKEVLTYEVRLLGRIEGFKQFDVVNRVDPVEWDWFPAPYYNTPPGWFKQTVDIVPGKHAYVVTHKMIWVKDAREYAVNLGILVKRDAYNYDLRDVKHPNNIYQFVFRR